MKGVDNGRIFGDVISLLADIFRNFEKCFVAGLNGDADGGRAGIAMGAAVGVDSDFVIFHRTYLTYGTYWTYLLLVRGPGRL